MRGGNDKTRYSTSFGYLKDVGYIINSEFTRYAARVNVDSQVKKFLLLILSAIFLMTIWLYINIDFNLLTSLRISTFNVVSIITGTGYSTNDFSQWGHGNFNW